MYEMPGCVIREAERWLMTVPLRNGSFPENAVHLDIGESHLVRASIEIGRIAVFGKWTLWLGDRSHTPDRWMEIASFEWKSEGAES